jgi:acetolactate decarboxylase
MKNTFRTLLSFLIIIILFSCSNEIKENQGIFQTSTIDALLKGDYDGNLSFAELKKHGNFGLGTFNTLDGEMVALDGAFFQIKANGKVSLINEKLQTPFSVVCNFSPDKVFEQKTTVDLNQLKSILDSKLITQNIYYAIKIEGNFSYIKTRSVPAQTKPYPPLLEVIKNQPTFEYKDVKGTLVGFWFPAYMKGINVPKYHFHFISNDKTQGGHLITCTGNNLTISIDEISTFNLSLPNTDSFHKLDLNPMSQNKKIDKVFK